MNPKKLAGMVGAWCLLTSCSWAQIYADMVTSRGTITTELEYAKAPNTVANFIGLASGERSWVDPRSGAVRRQPYYSGNAFHRVINSDTFRIIQAGSLKGDGTDGPGYVFRDEFDASLTHQPYVLSMANSGSNSNGSQFFFTGSVGASHLNGVHSVFGRVTDAASRAVIDAIHAAGSNQTTILSIAIRRVGAAAQAFSLQQSLLPEVVGTTGQLQVTRNQSCTWKLQQPAALPVSCVFQGYQSVDLQQWSYSGSLFRGYDATGTVDAITMSDATAARQFFHLSLVRYPETWCPSTFANRTLVINQGGALDTFVFNATGVAGMATVNSLGSSPLTAPFSLLDQYTKRQPYGFTVVLDMRQFYSNLYLEVSCRSTAASNTLISGSQTTQYYLGFGWYNYDSGTMSLTK